MAIAKVADRASANSNSAVTTVDLVLSGLTVGNYLIIRTAADNSGGSGAARTVTVTNQSGTAIDTATDQAFQQNNDPGAASAGVTCNVFVAAITATSGTVRLTYSGSVVQAAVAEEWSGIDQTTPVVGTPVGANGTASTNLASVTDATVAVGNLAYGVEAVEGPSSDTYTQDADTTGGTWSNLTKLGTSNATATDNVTVYGGYKVVNALGGGSQTYNPTINNARDSAGLILELSKVLPVSLTVADSAHESTADAVSLTQHNTLTVADSGQEHTADAVTLTAHPPSVALTVADADHGHTSDPAGGLTQHNTLGLSDALHGHSADSPALTQHNVLTVDDASHPDTVDTVGLTQHNVLAVADSVHGHIVESVALTQHHLLDCSDAVHAHAAEAATLTQHHVLGVGDADHGHTADALTLTAHEPSGTTLTVDDASHVHTSDDVALTQHHIIEIAECILQHAVEQIELEQHHALTVADASHLTTSDPVLFAGPSSRRRRTLMSETIDLRPAKLTYRIRRGDDFADTVTIKEGDPLAAVDVSARTYTAQVRRTPSGTVVATMAIDMTDAATGQVTYSIGDTVTATMLGDYVWDFQQDAGGAIRTLMGGPFKVEADVTRAV